MSRLAKIFHQTRIFVAISTIVLPVLMITASKVTYELVRGYAIIFPQRASLPLIAYELLGILTLILLVVTLASPAWLYGVQFWNFLGDLRRSFLEFVEYWKRKRKVASRTS